VTRGWRAAVLVGLAHAALVVSLCWEAIFLGRVPYFRDVTFEYVPDFAFLAQSLAQHIWPLWNPLVDGGRPFLFGYLPDVALVGLLGPLGAARAEAPLHLWCAAMGASLLARRCGHGTAPAWAAGAFYASSGFLLSCGNLFPMLHAATWAPWVAAAGLMALERPSRRWVVVLAGLAAIQVGSLAVEIFLQTALVIVLLGARRFEPKAWLRLAAAGALAAMLAAPSLLGGRAMVAGSARAAGFDPRVTLGWSLRPAELPSLLLPQYFGDMHTFAVGFWGQALFHQGYPYFLSLYLGPIVLLLAALGFTPRLGLLALTGLVIALGAHGPLAPVVTAFLGALHIRVPSKFVLSIVIAVALMAAGGVQRASLGRPRAWVLAPGLALVLAGVVLLLWPAAVVALLARAVPLFQDPRAQYVAVSFWPAGLVRSGLLTLVAGFALWRGGRLAAMAALAGVADLVVAGALVDVTAPPSYYALRPPVRAVVEGARAEGVFRWFSYGAALSIPLNWRPEIFKRNRDLPLLVIQMQSLVPRTQELFGLEGAFDEDRTSFAPRGTTLTAEERHPARFREIHPRLRFANVRWVIGYGALPEDLVVLRASVPQPEVEQPLHFFELRDPLPRVFWVPAAEVVDSPERMEARVAAPGFDPRAVVLLDEATPAVAKRDTTTAPAVVSYERLDPHTVRLSGTTPPGFIVVLDHYDASWRARDEGGEVPLRRAYGQYWALPTEGGSRTIVAHFQPAWRTPSFVLSGLGLVVAFVLAARRR
jgi:hypothetical protein